MKKLIKLAGAAMLTAALLATSATAAIGDIKVKTGGVTKAPVIDGKVSVAEYGNCTPLVLDGSGKNTEGTWAGTKWGTEKFTIYSAWDAKNLYLGITVEGDTTNNQGSLPKKGDNKCPFGTGDSFQLGFNPGAIVKGQHPVLFCIGLNEGDAYIHADAYRSTEDGKQSIEYTGKFPAKSTKYSASGVNYVFETAIPWSEICVKGAGRAGEGAKVFDMTGELKNIKAGYELPFFFVYTDKNATGGNVYIRSDATTGAKWVAEEMGSIALVLQAAPKPAASTAASTPDMLGVAILALSASACAAYVIGKKR